MRRKVFISYSRVDAAFAQKLRLQLKHAELSAWLDVDGLKPGTEWQPRLEEALRSARAMVVCVSPASANSAYVTFEWSYALGAGVKVFPILVKETAMHPWLSRFQWIDLSGKSPPWSELINALKTVPRSRRSEPPTPKQSHRSAKAPKVTAVYKTVRAIAEIRDGPLLIARFDLKNGKPVMIGNEYSLALSVRRAPEGTKFVTYELHDESFDEPRFRVDNTQTDFEAWISSYGDVRVSVRAKLGRTSWQTDGLLGEALRRGHATHMTPTIKKAIETLEKY